MNPPKYRFSPSTLKLLYDCRRCFWYAHHARIPRPKGIFPGLPSAVDKIIQTQTARFTGKGKPTWLLPGQKGVINPGPKKLVQRTDEYTLTGIVDDLVIQDDQLIIIDYKTARAPYTLEKAQKYYSLQMDCYAHLCEGTFDQQVKAVYLVFFTPLGFYSEINEGEIEFNITHLEMPVNPKNAKRTIAEALEILDSEVPPIANPNCEYCRWLEQKDDYDSNVY